MFSPHTKSGDLAASNPIGIRMLPVSWTLELCLFFGGDKEKFLTLVWKRHGVQYQGSRVVISPDIVQGFQAWRKRLFSLKKNFANLGLDMAILFPAILFISFNNQKFVFFGFDVTHLFLAAPIQDLEKKDSGELSNSLDSDEKFLKNFVIPEF